MRVIKRLETIDFCDFSSFFYNKVSHGRNPIHKTHNCHYVINHFFFSLMLLGYMCTAWVFLLVKNNIFTGFYYGYNQINWSSGIVKILWTFYVKRNFFLWSKIGFLLSFINYCCVKRVTRFSHVKKQGEITEKHFF